MENEWSDDDVVVIDKISTEIEKSFYELIKAHSRTREPNSKELMFEHALLNAIVGVSMRVAFQLAEGDDLIRDEFIKEFKERFDRRKKSQTEQKDFLNGMFNGIGECQSEEDIKKFLEQKKVELMDELKTAKA